MGNIKFRIAAKTDIGLVRTNNEDNFQAAADLSTGQMRWINNEICSISEKGALFVVADGMGGTNAGEVASEIAITTVRDCFASEKLTSEVIKTRHSIEKYMNDTIILADARIKSEAKSHPETRGMGTTIVIGWLLEGKLYVSWCGDSRAYVYNPAAGLHQITRDHSYVQSLVDKGSISHEDAFDFPDSNIITRCLSDAPTKAKPESLLRPYEVCNNDIILLCTDGLCGMIRDNEIEHIIRANEHNMDELSDHLIQGACDAEGSDNITICLCQIMQGGKICNPSVFIESDRRLRGNSTNLLETEIKHSDNDKNAKKYKIYIIGLIALLAIAIGGVLYWRLSKSDNKTKCDAYNENVDSLREKRLVPKAVPEEERVIPSRAERPSQKENQIKATEEKSKKQKSTNTTPKDKKEQDHNNQKKDKDDTKNDDQNAVMDELSPTGKSVNSLENINNGRDGKSGTKTIGGNTNNAIKTKQYKVKEGDSFYKLAKQYQITTKELQDLNKDIKVLKVGQLINVPIR
jgi:serine/threonine protein phosphatase PrpC/LysM repeat protein